MAASLLALASVLEEAGFSSLEVAGSSSLEEVVCSCIEEEDVFPLEEVLLCEEEAVFSSLEDAAEEAGFEETDGLDKAADT